MNSTKRKRTFTYVHKKGICMHVSQVGGNENNDFSTSTSTSTNIQPGTVIEEHGLPVMNNQYHISKSQDENFYAKYTLFCQKESFKAA